MLDTEECIVVTSGIEDKPTLRIQTMLFLHAQSMIAIMLRVTLWFGFMQ